MTFIQWFRYEIYKEEEYTNLESLLNVILPVHQVHNTILKDIELRIAAWEGKGGQQQRIGDILLDIMNYLPVSRLSYCKTE